MRIFLAIFVNDKIINKVINFQLENENLKVNWVAPENLHITLLPPWEEKRENIEECIKILESTRGSIEPFELNFKGICPGGNKKNPHLIWVEGEKNSSLLNIKKILAQKFRQKFLDRNPAKPHITIARYNNNYIKLDNFWEKISWQMLALSIALIESELRQDRAYYRVLHKIKL